ncbi:MAG: hypothetical protein A2046_01105 [Bacteroidetes bacterium GWA2_30_7]|nr:MAG: hypothetical protein A2046_01105 [Bacteroidetes bacterium GWA2_30_7]
MTNILTDNNIDLNLYSSSEIAKKIASKAKEKRLSFNYTQEALSKKSGVSLGSLKRFERSYEISLQNLLLLALALNSIDEFINLFPENKYSSIDEVIKLKNVNKRKRGRIKD